MDEKITIDTTLFNETFKAMKNEYGKNMSNFIRGEELDEGETIEDIEIDKE